LAVDANGNPLAATLTAANRNDVTQLLPLVDAIPPVAGTVGAPLRKPGVVLADRGYDSNPHRMALSCRNIGTRIGRRRTPHGSGLGADRYVVERSLACLHQFRRMRTRFERRDDIHEALMSAAMSMMCWRRLHNSTG
jgi:transposase